MPDLPLPKPQPPTGSTAPAVSVSPTSPVTPVGTVVSPQPLPPTKPPAVVTALSSVSSNQLPTINPDPEEKTVASQSGGVNASMSPTSAPSVVPPPTLAASKLVQPQTSIPARGAATNQGATQPIGQTAGQVASSPTTSPQSPTTVPSPALVSVPPANPVPTPGSASLPNSSSPPPISTTSTTNSPQVGISNNPSPSSATTQTITTQTPTSSLSSPIVSTTPVTPTSSSPPPPPSASTAAPPPPLAKPKKSPLKLILALVAAVVGLAVIVAIVMAVLNRPSRSSVQSGDLQPSQPSGQVGDNTQSELTGEQATIEYWGLWETSEVLNQVLQDFQTQNPGLIVRYIQQSHRDYRERLQSAIASGSGPDLFRFHASWAPMLSAELEPMPASVMSVSDFSQTFYPAASRQLQLNGQLVGVPLMYEGLVLYYNQDVLETAGVSPPQSWSDLRDAARTLSIKQENGQLQRGGVAIGTAENVDHFADILAVLMLQNGANLEQPSSPEGRDALLFYTNFVKQDQVWSADLPSSTLAFARGDVAMMFAPTWRAFEITQTNPNLRFAAVTLPQLPNNKITWASYWAEGVSKQSQNKEAAWKLLQYLTQKEVQQKLFSAQSQTRAFGEPFSRVDLADQAASQPILGPLLQDAPAAQGWYMSTFTHDNGINDQIIQYYKDAVNSLLGSGSIDQILVTLQEGVNQVLSTYGVVAPLEPTPTVAQY